MPWQPIDISNEEAHDLMKAFPRASRFMVDENLGPELAPTLRSLGYNTTDTHTLKLNGRSDEEVFAAAWRERRILLTQDRVFLDDRRFPRHRNPGVVVLPAFNEGALINALVYALALVRKGRELWEEVKMVVCEDGILTVIGHNHDTGTLETSRYKLRIAGPPLMWSAEKPKVSTGGRAAYSTFSFSNLQQG
jgi:predicted nuclease of predicted toxin-antitoxin system